MSKLKKKVLYIDMDGVVADFWKAIKLNQPKIEDKKYFPTYADQEKEVDAICERNPHIFRYLLPMKGSIEATKPLFKKFDVIKFNLSNIIQVFLKKIIHIFIFLKIQRLSKIA